MKILRALGICLVSWLLVATFSPVVVGQSEEPTPANIAAWIEQLGSPQFGERESAASRLQAAGPNAVEALHLATSSHHAGIAQRARAILDSMPGTLPGGLTAEDRQTLLNFRFADSKTRDAMMRELTSPPQIRVIFLILEQFPDAGDYLFKNDAAAFHNMLVEALVNDQWEDVRFALNHPLTRRFEPGSCLNYHWAQGTFPEIAIEWETAFLQQREAGLPLDELPLRALIAMWRLQGNFASARQWIPQLSDPETRRSLQTQLLFEQGDWAGVLATSTSPEEGAGAPDRLLINPCQKAFLLRLSEDSQGYRLLVDQLKTGLAEATAAQNQYEMDALRGQLRLIGLTNLDWALVYDHLDPAATYERYTLFSDLNRYDDAFAAIGLGDRLNERLEWVTAQIEARQRLEEKLRDLDNRDPEARKMRLEVNQIQDLLLRVSGQLGTLGFVDEATLYYQMLFAVEAENQTIRNQVLVGLLELEQFEAVWRLLESGFPDTSAIDLAIQLFGDAFPAVNTWASQISNDFPDPIDHLKVLSGVVNSPMGTTDDFQLEREIARYRARTEFSANGNVEVLLAMIFELHGQWERSDALYREAAALNSLQAQSQLQRMDMLEGAFREPAEFYSRRWALRRSATDAILAAMAYEQLAMRATVETDRAGLRESALKSRCAAYAIWRGRSYSVTNTLMQLAAVEQGPLAIPYLKSSVYCLNGNGVTDDRFRSALVSALADRESTEPAQGAIEAATRLFIDLGANNIATKTEGRWAVEAQQLQLLLARTNIATGKLALAADQLVDSAIFFPGDPTIGEDLISAIDAAGGSQQGDRVFAALAEYYGKLLPRFPNAALLHNNYAWTAACARRLPEYRLQHAQQAVRLRPHNASYLDTLAEIEFLSGNLQAAVELSQRSVALNPSRQYYQKQRRRFQKALSETTTSGD